MPMNSSMFNLLFDCVIRRRVSTGTERKRILKRKLVAILPLNSKLSGKFQRFDAISGSIEMINDS